MVSVIVQDEQGKTVATIGLAQKTFSTGSKGYHASSKVSIAGKAYQANLMLVEIGSKPGSAKKK